MRGSRGVAGLTLSGGLLLATPAPCVQASALTGAAAPAHASAAIGATPTVTAPLPPPNGAASTSPPGIPDDSQSAGANDSVKIIGGVSAAFVALLIGLLQRSYTVRRDRLKDREAAVARARESMDDLRVTVSQLLPIIAQYDGEPESAQQASEKVADIQAKWDVLRGRVAAAAAALQRSEEVKQDLRAVHRATEALYKSVTPPTPAALRKAEPAYRNLSMALRGMQERLQRLQQERGGAK